MLRAIKALVFITIKQLVGERLQKALFFIALLSLIGIPVVTQLSMFEVSRSLLLYSLNIITFLSIIFAIFSLYVVMSRDMGEKKIYFVLSMPISRCEYLFGRFIGVVFFITQVILVIFILYLPFAIVFSHGLGPLIIRGFFFHIVLLFSEVILLTGVGFIFYSIIKSPSVFIFVLTGFYVAGVNMKDARDFILSGNVHTPLYSKLIINAVYFLFPNLSLFDWKIKLVYTQSAVEPGTFLLIFVYGIVYGIISIIMAMVLFKDKDLV